MTATNPLNAVLEEIAAGDRLTLTQAARIPGVDPATAYRWWSRGTKLPNGTIVRLQAVRIGSRVITSKAAMHRYLKSLNDDPKPAAEIRSPSVRQRQSEAAAATLDQMRAAGA